MDTLEAYHEFNKAGEGTYRGWMNVQLPDPEVLQPFAEYGLWEYGEDSPIHEQQIGECIAIGTTLYGDFLAVHPQTAGLLRLPRYADDVCYEPWTGTRSHLFLRLPPGQDQLSLRELATVCVKRIFRRICPLRSRMPASCFTENWAAMYD
ncbi:hypothetical protein [Paenibacillus sp. NPDC057934]|uniref:hypothetical protein n=1 Tax=Paenibacillus sp. NPDC057934 TaxID=3346282 RepID=UPI0036DB87D9